jgi:hypothetical protein
MGTGVYVAGPGVGASAAGPGGPHGTYIEHPIPIAGPPLDHRHAMTTVADTLERPRPGRGTGHPVDMLAWARRLSESAEAIATAAARPGGAGAIGSALAQIEAALANLERGSDAMEAVARARLAHAAVVLGDPWNDVVVARTAHDFDELGRALANARRACETVRRGAGPILAELSAV